MVLKKKFFKRFRACFFVFLAVNIRFLPLLYLVKEIILPYHEIDDEEQGLRQLCPRHFGATHDGAGSPVL